MANPTAVVAMALGALLAAGCTVAQPQHGGLPPPPPGAVPPSPPYVGPAPTVRVQFPGAGGDLTKAVSVRWQGSPLVWRSAMLEVLIDPANPMKLTSQERAGVREALRAMMIAEEEVAVRTARFSQLLGDGWVAAPEEREANIPMPEDGFRARYPDLVKKLGEKAAGRSASASALPENIGEPEDPNEDGLVPDAAAPQRPDQIAAVIDALLSRMSPEQAAQTLAELRAMEGSVERMTTAWQDLIKVTDTPDRLVLVKARAVERTGEPQPYDRMELLDRVMHFVAGQTS